MNEKEIPKITVKVDMPDNINDCKTVSDLQFCLIPYEKMDLELVGDFRTWVIPEEEGKDKLVILPLIDNTSTGFEKLKRELLGLFDQQQHIIKEKDELIKLIANACIYSKENSVKEILRKEIKGIDTVAGESSEAWHDYVVLSKFFKEHYKEDWDND